MRALAHAASITLPTTPAAVAAHDAITYPQALETSMHDVLDAALHRVRP